MVLYIFLKSRVILLISILLSMKYSKITTILDKYSNDNCLISEYKSDLPRNICVINKSNIIFYRSCPKGMYCKNIKSKNGNETDHETSFNCSENTKRPFDDNERLNKNKLLC